MLKTAFMGNTIIPYLNEDYSISISNLRSGDSIKAHRVGRIVFLSVTVLNAPSGWTNVATLRPLPIEASGVVVANGPVTGFGWLQISATGELSLYHALGSNNNFQNINYIYITKE